MATCAFQTAQPPSFLSQPPASKKRSAQPPSAMESAGTSVAERRRSTTVTSINTWAANVKPGPPAPISPSRGEPLSSDTYTRRAARRKSFAPAPPSPVAYLPEDKDSPTSSSHTITPTLKPEAKPDLPAVGYTSIFVTLPPKTPPATSERRRSVQVPKMSVTASVPPSPAPPPASKPTGLGRLRSFALHPRSKSISDEPSSSAGSSSKSKHAKEKKEKKEKKAKYDDRPLQMSQELALMQFMGGGKMETHMQQYAVKQAKASGAPKVHGQRVGVDELYRDGRGGVWRDQDEELEYRGLLGENSEPAQGADFDQWVGFDGERGAAAFDGAEVDPLDTSARSSRAHRRRTAPLSPVTQNTSHRSRAANSTDGDAARREFLDSSFVPAPSKPVYASANPSSATVDSYPKKSVLKGLFRSKKAARA